MPITVPASETTATSKGITRNNLMKRILRESGLGDYGTATGGSTTTIVDTTKLKSSQFSDDEWVDGWARISKDAGGAAAAPEAEVSPITAYAPSTGTVTFNPAMTAAVASGDEYELWKFPSPRTVIDIIDQCLKNDIYIPYWSPLSEVPDFDMEQSHTTDWTANNATVTKQTSNPMRGHRYLRVVASAANGYARTDAFYIQPNKQYYVSVLGRSATTDNIKLEAYDSSNSATIDSVTGSANATVRLGFTFTTPSTCYQIQIRVYSVANGATSEYDDLVLYALDDKQISLPWWVEDRDQVKGIFRGRDINIDTNIYTPDLNGDFDSRWTIMENSFGRGKLAISTRQGTLDSPLFIFGIRNETAYANDNSDIKLVDEDYLVACVMYQLMALLAREPREGYLDAKYLQNVAIEWKAKWEIESFKLHQRLNSIVSPAPTYSLFQTRDQDLGWH